MRPQGVVVNNDVCDLTTTKRAYKRAKKAYEGDKSNGELKRAKREAKNALKGAEEASSDDDGEVTTTTTTTTTTSSSVIHADAAAATAAIATSPTTIESPEERLGEKSNGEDDHGSGESSSSSSSAAAAAAAAPPPPPPDDDVIEALRRAYQYALAAFKSDRGDKDLRRAKTAALRALEGASLRASDVAGGGGTRLTCAACSKRFVYTIRERERHEKLGWEVESSTPKRCGPCRAARGPPDRRKSSSSTTTAAADERRIALDCRVRNMCYAFQRGECPRGARCKFSHNPEHGGGKKPRGDGGSARDGNNADDGNFGASVIGDAKLGVNDGLNDEEKDAEKKITE
jgi:hypothetical protein